MNVFQKMTIAFLRKNKMRTLVTIIGVILSVSMFVSITTFLSTLQQNTLQSEIDRNGDWHVELPDIAPQTMKKIQQDARVAHVTWKNEDLYIDIADMEAPLVFASATFLQAEQIKIVGGRLPKNSEEIIVPNYRIGGELGLKIGDTITAHYGVKNSEDITAPMIVQGQKTFTIVGAGNFPMQYMDTDHYFALAPDNMANITAIVTMKNPKEVYNIVKDYGVPQVKYNSSLLMYYGVLKSVAANETFLGLAIILISIIVIGSVLLIYNAFAISVTERTKYFGLLSSIGATKKQLRKMVFFEAMIIALIGIPLGLLSGIVGIGITMKVLEKPLTQFIDTTGQFTMHISYASILIAVLLAVITIIISVWVPAKRASKQTAIEAIRQARDIRQYPTKTKKLSWIYRVFGLEGMIANRNFTRNKRQYRTTIISLAVSMVLVVAAGAFTNYLKMGVGEVKEPLDYDIMYYLGEQKDIAHVTAVLQQNKALKNITATSLYQAETTAFNTENITFLVYHTGFDEYAKKANLAGAQAILINKMYTRSMDTGKFIIHKLKPTDEAFDLAFNMNEREMTMTVDGATNLLPIGVSGIIKEMAAPIVIMSPSYAKDLQLQGSNIDEIYMSVKDRENSEQVRMALERQLIEAGYSTTMLNDVSHHADSDRNFMLIVNVFCYGFIVLISLIAIANVFNTISTNVMLRTKEFAILQSIGFSNKDLYKMLRLECVLYGLKAIVFGLPLSFITAIAIHIVMNRSISLTFMMPWVSLMSSIIGIFIIVALSMWYAVRKTKQASIIDALRNENR